MRWTAPKRAVRIAKFRSANAKAVLAIEHPNYGHMAQLPEPVRAELAGDFE